MLSTSSRLPGDCFGWMGEDWGSCFPRQQFDWQSPNLNHLRAPFSVEHHHTVASLMNPGADMVSLNENLPVYPSLEPPYAYVNQANEPQGWFYCLPRFRQAFTPALNSGIKEKLPTPPYGIKDEASAPKVDTGYSQKRFLVFDQSGDQTTLIFSSGIGAPVPCFTSWGPKPNGPFNLKKEDPETKENLNIQLRAFDADQFDEDDGADLQSEMHEDTDELNALLYSDDDGSDYTEDDEITSTGHSPSTMTAHNNLDWFKGSTEEVASSGGSTKKRKLFDESYNDIPALMDTASSVKPIGSVECEDDAESKCNGGSYQTLGEIGSQSSGKKMRKDRIRETVSILQNIIPGGEGKDAIVVLDEAISYLKSLKLKAKALGLDTP